ncbi:hypothetical protein COOONC_28177 [Cooperia oncophora]
MLWLHNDLHGHPLDPFRHRVRLFNSILPAHVKTMIDMIDEILRKRREPFKVDPATARELNNKYMKWKHITPEAPWQGGVKGKAKKGSANTPHEGYLIMIYEETHPRHSWRVGPIEDLCPSAQGIVQKQSFSCHLGGLSDVLLIC